MQQLLIHVIPLFFALYAYISIFGKSHLHWVIKGIALLFIFFASQYPAFCRSFFAGHDDAIPYLGIILWSWLFASQLLLIIFAFLKDIVFCIFNLAGRPILVSKTNLAFVIGTFCMILGAYGSFCALKQPQIRHVTVEIENLPPAFNGFTIAQLSDLHISALLERSRLEKIIQSTLALKPDLIAVTGDIVDGRVDVRKQDVTPLSKLHAPYGVFAVEGNHDHYVDYDGWMRFLPTLGITVLHNSHRLITRNGQSIAIAGVNDPMAKRYHRELPNIEKALSGLPKEMPIVLLSHQIKNSRDYARHGVALQLSGHTHGGQIFGMHWLAQALNDGFVKGKYDVDGMTLYVNRGTGLWYGFPIRIGIFGEITLFTLHKPS